jgi:hypothetical protein
MWAKVEATGFLANLDEWVKLQKQLRKTLENMEQNGEFSNADRLELILAARFAFQQMIRTLKAFDQWLQDPMIIRHMPKEMLEEVRRTSWQLLRQLLDLDVHHTSEFKQLIEKLNKEGKLDPLIWMRNIQQPEEQQRRGGTFTTM